MFIIERLLTFFRPSVLKFDGELFEIVKLDEFLPHVESVVEEQTQAV